MAAGACAPEGKASLSSRRDVISSFMNTLRSHGRRKHLSTQRLLTRGRCRTAHAPPSNQGIAPLVQRGRRKAIANMSLTPAMSAV